LPDDPKATSPGLYLVVGLASLVMLAGTVALLVLPPLFLYAALTHGHTALAAALGSIYFIGLLWVGSRLFRARPRAEE
jgi:hypothetical protein